MYIEVGIEGQPDFARESIKYQFDPQLTEEQNQEINDMRMQNAQMKLQIALLGMMSRIPELIEAQSQEDSTDE